MMSSDGNGEPQFAQHSANQIEPRCAVCEPCGAQAVQSGQRLLLHRLRRNMANLVVPKRFEQCLSIALVGLLSTYVRPDPLWRQEADLVP
jgi:hypothetical protein